MTFEQFSQGDSLLHRTDPRVKIIGALVLGLVVALCRSFDTALAGLAIALLLTAAARLSPLRVARRLAVVNSFNLLLWALLPLTYGRAPMIDLMGLHASLPGILLAALVTVKSNAILLFFISLPATSVVAELGHGLQRLRLSPRLCMLLLFSYRYISVLHREYQRLQQAARLRCFVPRTNLHTYRTYSHLLGMLLVKSWNRAARVQQAMALRGFDGTFHSLQILAMKKTDYLLLAVLLTTGLFLFLLEVVG
jgi:cobalt/nickel transport system permease protein